MAAASEIDCIAKTSVGNEELLRTEAASPPTAKRRSLQGGRLFCASMDGIYLERHGLKLFEPASDVLHVEELLFLQVIEPLA